MMLCDWAEELNGKLYVMGGGWNRVGTAQPTTVCLAVLIRVPWDQANQRHSIRARLVTDDGEPFVVEEGKPLEIEGQMEVGRPPGLRPGTPLNAPMALRFQGLQLPPGAYSWRFEVDGTELAHVPFEAVEGSVK